MKPSDFILNSDYLSLAQISKTSPQVVAYPSRVFPVDSQNRMLPFHTDYELTSKAQQGAIDRFSIVYNNKTYLGNSVYSPAQPTQSGDDIIWGQSWCLQVYRKNKNTIVARCDFIPPTQASSVPSTPTLTFRISNVSFAPPNIF